MIAKKSLFIKNMQTPLDDIANDLLERLKLLEASGVRFIEAAKKTEKIVFVVEGDITPECAGLISKMREAMGFSEANVKVTVAEGFEERRGVKAIVAFGEGALKKLKPEAELKNSRGTFLDLNGVKFMPTHALSTLLAGDRAVKAETWEDLKKVMAAIKE